MKWNGKEARIVVAIYGISFLLLAIMDEKFTICMSVAAGVFLISCLVMLITERKNND